MARVFNISFNHKEKSYTALVYVSGSEDLSVKVTTTGNCIQILLPTGSLSFSIAEVMKGLYVSLEKGNSNATFYVTSTISLQLMNTEW